MNIESNFGLDQIAEAEIPCTIIMQVTPSSAPCYYYSKIIHIDYNSKMLHAEFVSGVIRPFYFEDIKKIIPDPDYYIACKVDIQYLIENKVEILIETIHEKYNETMNSEQSLTIDQIREYGLLLKGVTGKTSTSYYVSFLDIKAIRIMLLDKYLNKGHLRKIKEKRKVG